MFRKLYSFPPNLHTSSSISRLLLVFVLLNLESRKLEGLTHTSPEGLPAADISVLVPCQDANPRLDIIVQLQDDLVGLGDLARRMSDLILGFLVLDAEFATVGVDALALGALLQLTHGSRTDVGEVIGTGRGDDLIPDDGLVGGIGAGSSLGAIGPFGRDVDEDLLRVPGEEVREVGVEGELDDGIFFLLARVVMGPALDDLDVCRLEGADGGGAWGNEIGEGNDGGDEEGYRREKAKCILGAGYRVVHLGRPLCHLWWTMCRSGGRRMLLSFLVA